MTVKEKSISPTKRYFLRINELAQIDPQIGALRPEEAIRIATDNSALGHDEVIAKFLKFYKKRPALGTRSYEIKQNRTTRKQERSYIPSFSTVTYGELLHCIQALTMAWRKHPDCQVEIEDFVCTIGFASFDFAIIDFACAFAKAVTVPLQSSTSGADLGEIFSNVEPVLLAVTLNDLPLAVEHAMQQKSIQSVLVFNYDKRVTDEKNIVEVAKEKLIESNIKLLTINELIAFGEQFEFTHLPKEARENEKMAAILHSSGSTGKPKGAVISSKALINNWRPRPRAVPRVTVLNAPLNHVMGRVNLINALRVGGMAYFTLMPDLSTNFEDIRIARPTFLSLFPRLLELIYQYYQNEVTKRLKQENSNRIEVEAAVKSEMGKTFLGDRLLFGVVGSAPTSPKVRVFMQDTFDILFKDGYGNTETGSGGISLDGKINRAIVVDYKLKDVPELGYFTTDKPYPRGELCVKTKFMVQSYFKQPKATAGLLDAEGYNLTGDIVEERAPDYIVVVDRRKDVLKLAQGEYVAVGPLGKVFEAGSAAIHQIYVYGNSLRAYLLAVVVPEMEVVEKVLGMEFTTQQLKNLIRGELQKVGQKEELKSFEIPKDFILEKERFSQINGLLSSVRKYLRPAIKRKYGAALEALYEQHEQVQEAEISALKDPNSTLTTKEKLIKVLESNLGIQGFETQMPRTFNELGGDSLGASMLSNMVDDIFGVSLGADVILSPNGHIDYWVGLIKSAQNQTISQPTFNSIHGKGTTIVYAKALTLAKFINKDLLKIIGKLPSAKPIPKTVLLTGANGFLGHILCLQWLEELAKVNGQLICLIRGKNNAAARKRLDAKFLGLDAKMESLYHQLSDKHLEVLAGDISAPNLGLDAETFDRLAHSVDRICHPAALVNHRLGYQHLFGPNIVGTTELIQLAITHQKKPIDFISTVAVQNLVDKSQGNTENAPLKTSVKLSNNYASGYATSKWAAEHLLHQAHHDLGLPVNIFRCDLILADQNYQGQVNKEDMVTRLFYSIIKTGLAPKSFYQLKKDGSRAAAHYDGIPVDELATSIVGLSKNKEEKCTTFNAQNYLKDEVSLDCFVDWINSAGYDINRIENHQEWYSRMETKLKSLPAEQRQHSMIDILAAYSRPYPTNKPLPDCTNFRDLVQKLNKGKDIPHLSEEYIHKYLQDMKALNLI